MGRGGAHGLRRAGQAVLHDVAEIERANLRRTVMFEQLHDASLAASRAVAMGRVRLRIFQEFVGMLEHDQRSSRCALPALQARRQRCDVGEIGDDRQRAGGFEVCGRTRNDAFEHVFATGPSSAVEQLGVRLRPRDERRVGEDRIEAFVAEGSVEVAEYERCVLDTVCGGVEAREAQGARVDVDADGTVAIRRRRERLRAGAATQIQRRTPMRARSDVEQADRVAARRHDVVRERLARPDQVVRASVGENQGTREPGCADDRTPAAVDRNDRSHRDEELHAFIAEPRAQLAVFLRGVQHKEAGCLTGPVPGQNERIVVGRSALPYFGQIVQPEEPGRPFRPKADFHQPIAQRDGGRSVLLHRRVERRKRRAAELPFAVRVRRFVRGRGAFHRRALLPCRHPKMLSGGVCAPGREASVLQRGELA